MTAFRLKIVIFFSRNKLRLGGSSEYPHSLLKSIYKKIIYTPVNLSLLHKSLV